MKQLVIVDLDDTLYDEQLYFSAIFRQFEQHINVENGILLNAFERICRPKSRDVLGDCLIGSGLYSRKHHDLLFALYCSATIFLPLPEETLRFLSSLKIHGCKTAVLTNGVVAVQKNKIRSLDIAPLLDGVFYARENSEGFEKPDPRSFLSVVQHFGCRPDQAIMIGDNYVNDYQGATLAGIAALWLNKDGQGDIVHLEEAMPHILGGKYESN